LYWFATVWLTLELAIGGVIDLLRGREVVVIGANVDQVVSSLGYPVYILLFLGVWKITAAAASNALVGHDLTVLIYPVIVTLITLLSWALRPPDRMLLAGA